MQRFFISFFVIVIEYKLNLLQFAFIHEAKISYWNIWAEAHHFLQYSMYAQRTQVSLCIRADWSKSLLTTRRCFWSLITHRVPWEDFDQIARMCRLIWVFAGHTYILEGNAEPGSYANQSTLRNAFMKKVAQTLHKTQNYWTMYWSVIAVQPSHPSPLTKYK